MKIKKLLMSIIMLSGSMQLLWAADIKMGGVIFAHYEYVLSDFLSNGTRADDRNEFDVSRVYLNAASKLDDRMDVFGQLETNLSSRDNTSNQTFLKQAWLRWNEVYRGASARAGLVPLPWRGFEESIWKHRFVAKTMEDEQGLTPATDRGVVLNGKIPFMDYDVIIANGEGVGARGTTGNETNKHKDYAGRISVSPFKEGSLKGFKVSGLLHKGKKMDNWPRDRVFSSVSYECGRFNVFGGYFTSRDGNGVTTGTDTVRGRGISLYTNVNLSEAYVVFLRLDKWDPNKDVDNDARRHFIGGVEKKISDAVRITLDYHEVIQEKTAVTRKNQNIVSTHAEVKF